MDIENTQKQDAAPATLKATGHFQFHDPEEMAREMAKAMPGGEYGILPLSKEPFHGEVNTVNFGDGVAMCNAKFIGGINIRAELGRVGNVGFLLPEIGGRPAILNGRPIDGGIIQADCMDASYNMRTSGEHEAGLVLVELETMRELMDIHQHAIPPYLKTNTSLLTDPSRISNLNALLLKASRLLKNNLEEPHWTIAQDLIRDEILTELVSITIRSSIRHEHRAHLNQNASMARIDNYIDTHAFGAIELQRLCMGVALSLRTVERVIRNRTGLTALTYFRKRKLAFARQVLLHPNNTTTVTNTALDFGFLHFSRFSAEYRAMYGELPSTTLNRARS